MSSFSRPVSTIEKLYVVYDRLRPPFCNQVVVLGDDAGLDAGALREALARASEANPGACLRMSGHLAQRTWVTGAPPRLETVRGSRWDGRGPADFLDRRLDAKGPTCELLHVEGVGLVFRSLHAVMDGLGTLLWARDVLRCLRGEAPLGQPSAWTDTQFAAGLNPSPLELPGRDALSPTGRADAASSGNDFVWRRVTLDVRDDVPIVAALAVRLAEECRRHGDGRVRLNVPADLRFFHPEQRSTGNVIGTLFLDVPPGASVAGVAADLKARLKAKEHARFPANYEKLRWMPMGALETLVRRGFADEHASGSYSFSATLSFLGSVDPAWMTAPGFRPTTTFWVPPMADQGCFVAACRFAGQTELMLALPRVLASRGRLDALLGRLETALVG